jgi:tetratricopeptide (TPR) repeat protein
MTPLPRLYLSVDPDLDYLSALEFGRVDDGQPEERWAPVSARFAYLHAGDRDHAPPVGFKVRGYSEFDPEDDAIARIWEPPRFHAPQLGLPAASAGEIVLAARRLYGSTVSVNRAVFNDATGRGGPAALHAWLACLQSGDPMAHFALGYTLYEEGRFHEAYRHLRYYVEIAPAQSWNHVWLGKAAEAIGEPGEARAAYERAIELPAAGAEETDAPELLAGLERPAA